LHGELNPKTILVITGDITDAPTKAALDNASALFGRAREHFDHLFYVPGNHDIKRVFGNLWRTDAFEQTFGHHAPLYIQEIGLRVFGFDSNANRFARGGVPEEEFDVLMRSRSNQNLSDATLHQEFRIAALHHHPLPFPNGEGTRIAGVLEDEPYMYLKHPASFLGACMSWNIRLVLHGHKHIHGLARYSVPTNRELMATDVPSSRWDSVYILSCPSTTGINCEAGFNVIDFDLGAEAPSFSVSRYARSNNNTGNYRLIDANEPSGRIVVHLADAESDPAITARRRLSSFELKPASEGVLYPIIEGLFRRGAFRHPHPTQTSWGRFYHAVVLTRIIWDSVVTPRLSHDRRMAAVRVTGVLNEYERFLAQDVFGLSDASAAEVKGVISSENKERFLQFVPRLAASRAAQLSQDWNERRAEILKQLQIRLVEMGFSIQLLVGVDN
jgi:hypothetical protein